MQLLNPRFRCCCCHMVKCRSNWYVFGILGKFYIPNQKWDGINKADLNNLGLNFFVIWTGFVVWSFSISLQEKNNNFRNRWNLEFHLNLSFKCTVIHNRKRFWFIFCQMFSNYQSVWITLGEWNGYCLWLLKEGN